MTFEIRVVAINDNGQEQIHNITSLQRTELKMETLGLTLAEGKTILSAVQHVIVEAQTAQCMAAYRQCSDCGQPRTGKGHHDLPLRTVFGKVTVASPRLRIVIASRTTARASVPWRRFCPSEPRQSCCFWRPNGHL